MAKLHALVLLLLVACKSPPAPIEGTSAAPTTSEKTSAPFAWPADKPLRVLTYNVLATPIYAKERTAGVLAILDKANADIIALQEVDDWFLSELTKAPWAKTYHFSSHEGRPVAPGGQLIMSRHGLATMDAIQMPGRQGRILMVANVNLGGRTMSVATTHMESFLEDGKTRAQQLDGIFRFSRRTADALVLGDLNFGDGAQPETDHLDPKFVDLWSQLRPAEPGFTWNMADNPLARFGAFRGEPDRRLDRILVRSDVWRPKSIRIIGNAPIGKQTMSKEQHRMIAMPDSAPPPNLGEIDLYPSDHYGLLAELTAAPKSR